MTPKKPPAKDNYAGESYMVKYIVKKSFDYGTVTYKPGDLFEPQGLKNDDRIKRSLCYEYKEPLR